MARDEIEVGGAGQGAAITISNRIRQSPFYAATCRYGATDFTVYNHMWMPIAYAQGDADTYRALTERVTIWDTAAERQVEIRGRDAETLIRRLTPRNLQNWRYGVCKYVLLCDQFGGVLNDPVALKLADDRYWLSIADADMLYWAQGLAFAWGLDVEIAEPDVSPAQVQGPLATELMRVVVGDWIDDLKFFHFRETEIDTDAGKAPVLVSRTGWSNERGYELFLRDGAYGDALWERLFGAGRAFDAAPGHPHQANRIEAGMLSHGADMDRTVNPFELGLGRLVDLDQDIEFIGRAALRRMKQGGPARVFVGFKVVDGVDALEPGKRPTQHADGRAGLITSHAFSPKLDAVIGLGLAPADAAVEGASVRVLSGDEEIDAEIVKPPFVSTNKRR